MPKHFMETMYHRPGEPHYHSEQDCSFGEEIPIDDREMGPGEHGQSLCPKCGALRSQRAKASQREEIARQARVEDSEEEEG